MFAQVNVDNLILDTRADVTKEVGYMCPDQGWEGLEAQFRPFPIYPSLSGPRLGRGLCADGRREFLTSTMRRSIDPQAQGLK